MVTIVTEVQVKEGFEPKWDEIMRQRMAAAKKHSGWVGGQLLQPADDPQCRVIIGHAVARVSPATTCRSSPAALSRSRRDPARPPGKRRADPGVSWRSRLH